MTDEINLDDKPLITAIDKAALDLLEKVKTDANVEKVGLLAEQISAFKAVVEWAKIKHAVDPPPPPDKGVSKFDGLKQRFNGTAPDGRRGPRSARKAKDDTSAGGDAATDSEPPTGTLLS